MLRERDLVTDSIVTSRIYKALLDTYNEAVRKRQAVSYPTTSNSCVRAALLVDDIEIYNAMYVIRYLMFSMIP